MNLHHSFLLLLSLALATAQEVCPNGGLFQSCASCLENNCVYTNGSCRTACQEASTNPSGTSDCISHEQVVAGKSVQDVCNGNDVNTNASPQQAEEPSSPLEQDVTSPQQQQDEEEQGEPQSSPIQQQPKLDACPVTTVARMTCQDCLAVGCVFLSDEASPGCYADCGSFAGANCWSTQQNPDLSRDQICDMAMNPMQDPGDNDESNNNNNNNNNDDGASQACPSVGEGAGCNLCLNSNCVYVADNGGACLRACPLDVTCYDKENFDLGVNQICNMAGTAEESATCPGVGENASCQACLEAGCVVYQGKCLSQCESTASSMSVQRDNDNDNDTDEMCWDPSDHAGKTIDQVCQMALDQDNFNTNDNTDACPGLPLDATCTQCIAEGCVFALGRCLKNCDATAGDNDCYDAIDYPELSSAEVCFLATGGENPYACPQVGETANCQTCFNSGCVLNDGLCLTNCIIGNGASCWDPLAYPDKTVAQLCNMAENSDDPPPPPPTNVEGVGVLQSTSNNNSTITTTASTNGNGNSEAPPPGDNRTSANSDNSDEATTNGDSEANEASTSAATTQVVSMSLVMMAAALIMVVPYI